MKGTLICIHFACLPAPRAPFEVKLDHHILHCLTHLSLSCGKSVAETQLSIIWEDWLLPVMLINNEMGNLTASRSLTLSLSASEMEQFAVSLTYSESISPMTDFVWLLHQPMLYSSICEHMSGIALRLPLSQVEHLSSDVSITLVIMQKPI